MTVWFFIVSYNATRRIVFLDGCRVTTSDRMITIGSLVLVVSNWIGASVSSAIWLIPFIVFMLGGLRESRRVLAKLSLMLFLDYTVKASHVLTRTEFMRWGWNLEAPYFSIHLALEVLQRSFSFALGPLLFGWSLMESPALSMKVWMFFSSFVLGHGRQSDYCVHQRRVSDCWNGSHRICWRIGLWP